MFADAHISSLAYLWLNTKKSKFMLIEGHSLLNRLVMIPLEFLLKVIC